MKKILVALSLFAFIITGCSEKREYVRDYYTSEAACYLLATSKMVTDQPITVDKKYKRSECPHCKGTGKMTHGDGHTSECTMCEVGDYRDLVSQPIKADGCCFDCICKDCDCTYPGECIIKANKGWPVKICDGDTCRIYYPHNEDGNEYNPYELLTDAQKRNRANDIYKQPIEMKIENGEVKRVR